MNITTAKRIARGMSAAGYHGIEIVLAYPEMTYTVRGLNRCWNARSVDSWDDWADLRSVG